MPSAIPLKLGQGGGINARFATCRHNAIRRPRAGSTTVRSDHVLRLQGMTARVTLAYGSFSYLAPTTTVSASAYEGGQATIRPDSAVMVHPHEPTPTTVDVLAFVFLVCVLSGIAVRNRFRTIARSALPDP